MSDSIDKIILAAKGDTEPKDPIEAADVLGRLYQSRESHSAAMLQFAWQVYREPHMWANSDFQEWEDWLAYTCDQYDISYTLHATIRHFVMRLAPWMVQNRPTAPAMSCDKETGEVTIDEVVVTPVALSERVGYSILHDTTSAAERLWRQHEKEPLNKAIKAKLDAQLHDCVRCVAFGPTRSQYDDWLKKQGYRLARNERIIDKPVAQVQVGDAWSVIVGNLTAEERDNLVNKRLLKMRRLELVDASEVLPTAVPLSVGEMA